MPKKAAGKNGDRAAGREGCIDGLLWIGQTYSSFFCGRPESCVDPQTPEGPHCFVHEADERGVSRRVPRVPRWAVPGKTRIFLAYRGGEKDRSRGRIFGYFVLERIEVIATPDSLTGTDGHDAVAAKPSPQGKPLQTPHVEPPEPEPDTEKPKVKVERCWNGEVIVTAVYDPRSKEWKPTDEKCPDPPELDDEDEDENGGVVFLPTDEEELAVHRGCSLRAKPGAVYVVDSLEAEIADAFAARLERGSIRKSHDEKAARGLFSKVVKQIGARHVPHVEVPDRLRGKAHLRGELILFDDPPLFEHSPQASFRGLAHIDGEALIDQIAAGVEKPEIHHCGR